VAKSGFEFGVSIERVEIGPELVEFTQELERLGYDLIMAGDHMRGRAAEPLAAMTWLAAATTRIRVGTHVIAADFRSPTLLAKSVATVDRLSGGRFQLGIGAGWFDRDYAMLGLPFDPPGVRISRMCEALDVIEKYWRGEPFDHAGKFYTMTGVDPGPLPVQPGGPPIFIGGGGPRIMRIAGARANIVGQNPQIRGGNISREFFEQMKRPKVADKIAWAREGAEAAGRDPGEITFHSSVNYLWVCESVAESEEMIHRLAQSTRMTDAEARDLPTSLIGTPDMIRDRLLRDRDELRFTAWSFIGGEIRGFGTITLDTYRAFAEQVMPLLDVGPTSP
jgi:probable F420-dependent oxidoreductase